MAKENNLHPALLLAISCGLLCAGWLMKSFPVFIFAGLAPLFAITDRASDEDRFWNYAELVLIALTIGFLAAHVFEMHFLVISLIQAIVMTLAFLAQSFVRQRLEIEFGKIPLVLFWLSLEFILVKLPWREDLVYLGDALELKGDWLKWTSYTGYLGTTIWILLANLLVYLTLYRGGKINWIYLTLTVLWIAGPISFSYLRGHNAVSRTDMIALHNPKNSSANKNYIATGEVIPAVAAGISVLLFLAAVVKNKDRG